MTEIEHTTEELAAAAVGLAIHLASITQNGWAGQIVVDEVAVVTFTAQQFVETIDAIRGRMTSVTFTYETSFPEGGDLEDTAWARLEWDHITKAGTLTYPAVVVNLDLS